jgi:Uri superfamily endonuclease
MTPSRKLAWIPPSRGSYVLIFYCSYARRIRIGALGRLTTEPGYYAYCGSAFGPGGLRARIARHLGVRKKKRWHIDYLRPFLRLDAVWYSTSPRRLEHVFADRLLDIAYATSAAVVPLAKFGASDCACQTHLVRLPFAPRPENIKPRRAWRHGIMSVAWRGHETSISS